MNHYEELLELFDKINDNDKFRIICRFILKLPTKQIALLEKRRNNTITMSFQRVETILRKIHDQDELIAVIQAIFCDLK